MHFSDNWFLIEFVTAVNCTMAPCTCCHSLKIQTASSFTNSTVEAQEAEEASITSQGSGVGPPMPTEKSSPRLSASSQVITVVLLKAWTLAAGDAFSFPFFSDSWGNDPKEENSMGLFPCAAILFPPFLQNLKSDFSHPLSLTYSFNMHREANQGNFRQPKSRVRGDAQCLKFPRNVSYII